MTRVARVAWLAVLWVALWGDLSLGTAVAGIGVALGILAVFPSERAEGQGGRFRPLPAVRFAGWFLYRLVVANAQLAVEALRRDVGSHTAIVGVPIVGCSQGLVTLVVNAFSLIPGSLAMDVRRDPTTIFVYVRHESDVERVRRDLRAIERLAVTAFGSAEAIELLERAESERAAVDPPEVR